MVTKVAFVAIVAVIFIQRLFEMRLSQRHVTQLLAEGGRKHGENYLWVVKVLQLSWFALMIAEVWWLDRPFVPPLAAIALLATIAGQGLRYLSMRSLGRRWTLPLITIPGAPAVDSGIYRYLRHPNWLGVILEIAAVPLIHTAYLTSLVFSVANAFLIAKRIQAEEQALSEDNNYAYSFAERPRFIPSGLLRTYRKSGVNKAAGLK